MLPPFCWSDNDIVLRTYRLRSIVRIVTKKPARDRVKSNRRNVVHDEAPQQTGPLDIFSRRFVADHSYGNHRGLSRPRRRVATRTAQYQRQCSRKDVDPPPVHTNGIRSRQMGDPLIVYRSRDGGKLFCAAQNSGVCLAT
jgi:hypothetical protein